MEMETFYHGLPIAAARNDDADRMHLIVQGRVRVVVSDPGTGPRETVSILTPGDFFGENALLGDRMWGSELGMPADYFADTLVMCRTLTRSALEELLGQYEEDLAEEFALAAECQGERGDQLTSASDAGDHDAVRPVVLARWTAIVRKMKRADNIQKIGLGGDEGRFLKRAALRIAAQEPRHWARRGSLRGQAGIPSAKSPHVPTPLTGNVKGGHGAHLDLDSDWGRSASGGSREGANSTSHSPGYPPTGSWGTQAGGTQAGDTQAERFRSLGRQAASRGGSQRSFHSRRGSQTSFADLPNGSNGDHSRLQPGKASHRKSDADALLVAAGEDGARALQEMRAILEMQARQLKEQGQILKSDLPRPHSPHRTHCTAPHRTAPHRTAPHRTADGTQGLIVPCAQCWLSTLRAIDQIRSPPSHQRPPSRRFNPLSATVCSRAALSAATASRLAGGSSRCDSCACGRRGRLRGCCCCDCSGRKCSLVHV
jgi:hypothetical protein